MSYQIITPQIEMQLKPMANLTEQTQKSICSCPTRCGQYVHLDEYGRYCESAAMDIALSIFSLVEGINRIEPKKQTRRVWSMAEEDFIKRWAKKYDGFRYGDVRIIATMLGRPYLSAREKIKQMQRDGLL